MLTSLERISAIDDIVTLVLAGDIDPDEALECILVILEADSNITWN